MSHLGNLCLPQVCEEALLFYSRSSILLVVMFRSLIYIKLIFVSVIRVKFHFFFQSEYLMFQHYLLKSLFFFHWIILATW